MTITCSASVSVLNPAGDIAYSRSAFNERIVTKSGQLLVSGKARTGPVGHDLAFGAFVRDDRADCGRTAAATSSSPPMGWRRVTSTPV